MSQEKHLKFSTEVDVNDVYNTLSKNYIEIITDYFELYSIIYTTFKDLDKYFILMSLVSKTLIVMQNILLNMIEQFYNIDQYELKNLILLML